MGPTRTTCVFVSYGVSAVPHGTVVSHMGQWSSAVGVTSVCPSGGDRQAHFMFYQPVKTTRCCKAWPASNTTASVRERRRSALYALSHCACRYTQHGSVGGIRQPPPRGYPATVPAGTVAVIKHVFYKQTDVLSLRWRVRSTKG